MWLAWIVACAGAPESEATATAEGAPKPVLLTEVRLVPVVVREGRAAHPAELRGLLTAALELGLADLPGVVPLLPGDGTPLAFRGDRAPPDRQVDARATLRMGTGTMSLELELCVAGGECTSTTAEATEENPWPAVAAVLGGAALALDVTVADATRAAWGQPGSKDAYSELITGRAAATYYGILPPTLTPGDRKQDAVVRAVFLDPEQPLAQWIQARWEVASTVDGGNADGAFVKAQLTRPTSPLFAADQAALFGLTGHPTECLLAWESITGEAPADPRWWLPLARARLGAGQASQARDTLETLPASYAWDPAVAELRVSAAEAAGAGEGLDPLLARWQAVDSGNPVPVRRRIDALVRAGRHLEAQALVATLRERAPGPATEALDVALLVALARYEAAIEHAPADLAVRILARARLEAIPGEVPPELPANDPLLAQVQASAALVANKPIEALLAAERAVFAAPAEALPHALRARALESSGRSLEASAAWTRAWDLDPSLAGGPVEPHRIASTFRYVEAGLNPEDVDGAVPIGRAGPEL